MSFFETDHSTFFTIASLILTAINLWFFMNRKKIVRICIANEKDEWLDIQKHPIPEEQENALCEILVTNGEKVKSTYKVNYDRYGKPLFNYENAIVTHWRPFPMPPKKD